MDNRQVMTLKLKTIDLKPLTKQNPQQCQGFCLCSIVFVIISSIKVCRGIACILVQNHKDKRHYD